jgi:ParB/RepB/Spo0J family partition protein
MAETVRLINPQKLSRNKENPRLIFREDELQSLQESIENQGILVPLTVFQDKSRFILLDGERRWRCAVKLGLKNVPVVIQPKPDRVQNIMMMFAIHKARSDWDPLPTALKLRELEQVLTRRHRKRPTEETLAAAASMSRGEVRRYRKILQLSQEYQDELMQELEKPRGEQELSVDQVLESTKGASALRKRKIIDAREERRLNKALIRKFRERVITNTVAPRKLAKIARAVERREIRKPIAQRVVQKLISTPHYTIDQAFRDSVEQVDYEHSLEQLITRLETSLAEHQRRGYEAGDSLSDAIRRLIRTLRKFSGT